MQVFEVSTPELLRAAMRVCDLHDDGEQAREDMRADVLATPRHLRTDLLNHFTALTRATVEVSAVATDWGFGDSAVSIEEVA